MLRMSDDVRARAEAHRLAAEAAEQATAWQDAVREYEQCLSLVAQDGAAAAQDEPALLTGLGRCYWNLSEARPAWRTLRRAMTLYDERNDGVGLARATIEIRRIWGPPERHRQFVQHALERLGDADPHLQALLLAYQRWEDETAYDRAMALAEKHGFDDVLAIQEEEYAWKAMREGRVEEATPLFDKSHDAFVAVGRHDAASGTLRGAAFGLIELGHLDEGFAMAQRSFDYAAKTHLNFQAQLALMDMAGVAFARGEFARCEEIVAMAPTNSDFRGDLYRMWIAEAQGDIDRALQLMVNPERGGNTPTAVGQIHAAAAGLLYRAGKRDAAAQALRAWAAVERYGEEGVYWMEAPAMVECLLDLADESLVREVHERLRVRDERSVAPVRFSTLQGRSLYPLRGGVCARLGLIDEAKRHYEEGLAWCEAEGCAADADACRRGLAAL
jgi:tetratricopeptide (TPR) repeat protein